MAASGAPGGMGGMGMGGQGGKIDGAQAKIMMQDHFSRKVMVVDDLDRQVWALVSDVPYLTKPVAIIAAILNFLLPGFGTALAACAADQTVSKTQLTVALIQFLTSVVLIGWIWAIYWGYLLVMKAMDKQAANMRGPMGGMSGSGQAYGSDPNMGYNDGFQNNRQNIAM